MAIKYILKAESTSLGYSKSIKGYSAYQKDNDI